MYYSKIQLYKDNTSLRMQQLVCQSVWSEKSVLTCVVYILSSSSSSFFISKTDNRSRRQGSIKPNSMHYAQCTNSVTVFIQRSSKEIFVTQVTDLCWQLSVVHASSQVVAMQRTVGEECMQCVSRIVQCLAEQPVVGLIQQLLKVR